MPAAVNRIVASARSADVTTACGTAHARSAATRSSAPRVGTMSTTSARSRRSSSAASAARSAGPSHGASSAIDSVAGRPGVTRAISVMSTARSSDQYAQARATAAFESTRVPSMSRSTARMVAIVASFEDRHNFREVVASVPR